MVDVNLDNVSYSNGRDSSRGSGKLLPWWQSIIETLQMALNGQKRYFNDQMTIFM